MALKTVKSKSASVAAPTAAPVTEPDSVLLELALYTNYTWNKETFQKGKAYKFAKDVAMELLSEEDHGRRVWRIYQPKPKPQTAQTDVVYDATTLKPPPPAEEPTGSPDPEKRINVGDDAEITDILNRTDPGDVTV